MKRLIGFGAVLASLAGCSSVIEGTSQQILVNTNPPGASCELSRGGAVIAQIPLTPGAVTIQKTKQDIAVVCRKSGYQDVSIVNESDWDRAVAGNILIGGLVGVGVDSASGAINKYDKTVNIALPRRNSVERAAAAMPGAALGDLANSDDTNVVVRFQTLQRLLDEGLITREEYNRRRGANLGVLLRYSAPLPAADLGRPAPDPRQVVDRLQYLAAAFEEKSITAREQSAERAIILEALLPVASTAKADPPPAINDQLQAAAAVSRLERLSLAKVISSDEQAREKEAVFRTLQVNMANAEAAARAAAGIAPPPAPPAPPTGPGLWLGTYRSENQARLAWASLQLTHGSSLGSLQPVVDKVVLRHHRGSSYQLKAGPVADRKAADGLCRTLRSKRQFCRPTTLGK